MEEVEMTYTCVDLIDKVIRSIQEEAPGAVQLRGRLQLLQMDAGFLKMFCSCLETWNFPIPIPIPTTDDDDEHRLRSMLNHLQVIWAKEYNGRPPYFFSRLTQTWPLDDVQHLNSLAFESEGIIHQSKLHIEKWCKTFLVHYSLMQCKPSTFLEILNFIQQLRCYYILGFSYGTDKIVPFKKQLDILENKREFLGKLLHKVEHCKDNKKLLQFLNFVRAFAKSAACLTFLYLAREPNEDEMNIFLFDMLHKFIPFAPDIIPLYIGLLNLQPSDPFHLGRTVASFIDLFFEHLATVLKEDDYLILRDKLIFIFTFLTGPPHEGDDSIRSQIYDLFRHEDAYLLLPFDEMKGDFSHKKIISIDIATANIIHMYCGFSDSWIRLEAERMDHMCFVSIQRELSSIEKNAYKERKKGTIYFSIQRELSSTEKHANMVVDQVQFYKMELRFLRMFLRCFATWDDTDEEIRVRLSSMITSLQGIWEKKGLLAPRLHAIQIGDISNWHLLTSELEGKIQMSKLEIEAWWVNLFHCPFRCRPSACNEALNKLDSILDNLKDLVSYRAAKIVPFEKQIETLKEKVLFLHNFLKLTANCVDNKELEEFYMFVQVLANDAACLTFLYWAQEEANDKIATETNLMLSHMLEKIKPGTPDVARLYFRTLQAIYTQRSDSFLFGQTVLSFVKDLFIEDRVTSLNHDFQNLQDDIIFLLTFLNDPPNGNAAELICCQMDVLFWEGVCDLVPFDDIKQDVVKKKVLLSDFVIKIQTVNVNIRQLYFKFPDSSLYNFPMVVAPQYLDFLLENLRNLIERMISDRKYAPFAKHHIINIEEELVSLRPFFNHIFELQSVLNDTWLQVVNLIHLTEHVISSCISSWFVFDHPIWYYMAYLSDVFERIKIIKTKLENITEKKIYNDTSHTDSAGFISTHLEQGRSSKINEVVVGFEDEAEKIIGMLTWGHTSLDTVSIVGMGGLGKTTIAKKVYGSSLVKCHFNIFAFCIVSQDHNTRRLLLDILRDIKGDDNKFSNMTDDDLAHQLWKYLSRQKYLIVLDDIWDISVWNKVKSSFPDDKNGSRVMFTTRSREVADKCKINCSPHHLRFMTENESWELLQKRVFPNGISPPNLYDIGMLISMNCKGLPLAIAVIAGLLARTERNESSWRKIAERLSSYLFDEGCMNVLELSYKHLPEYLKPCFIYLGAFPQDRLIKVKKVIPLWIAEGFIPKSNIKRLEDVAKEYLYQLVDRSLIIVNTRSSIGEIKTFLVHDLLHDLCQKKCQDGSFFKLRHGISASSSLDTSIYNTYRVSTENISDITLDYGPSFLHTRSLLVFCGVGYNTLGISVLLKDHRLAQVLHLEGVLQEKHVEELTSLVHVRHFEATVFTLKSIPSSIANLWNMQSLILVNMDDLLGVDLPETFWRMKSLRHVKVTNCKVKFSDSHENVACPKLDKVVSFSNPILSSGKDVERLLQRLPAVQELSCLVERSVDDDEESIETLDFYRKLESLKLILIGVRSLYLINFPSTLKKLTLEQFELPWTAISAIAKLHCLRVLKLRRNSFSGTTLEMEDVAFENLIFFELHDRDLVQWNAATESFPCLEHLLIECERLEELPSCFGEISTLKSIVVRDSEEVENSALGVGEQQMELGNEVEVSLIRREGTPEFKNLPYDSCDPFLRDFEQNFYETYYWRPQLEAGFEGIGQDWNMAPRADEDINTLEVSGLNGWLDFPARQKL